jgi:hypothetical protein
MLNLTCALAMAIGTATEKSHGPMGNIARTGPLSSDVIGIVTTTDDGITSGTGTMTAIDESSSSAEANVTVEYPEHHTLLKSPEKPGSFFWCVRGIISTKERGADVDYFIRRPWK